MVAYDNLITICNFLHRGDAEFSKNYLHFSPIWRCIFSIFGLQLLVLLLYNKQILLNNATHVCRDRQLRMV